MHKLNQHRTGLALGSFVGLIHLIWSILLALGWAKPLVDFIQALHSMQPSVMLTDFSIARSIALVVVTFIVGYVAGQIFAIIWNKINK